MVRAKCKNRCVNEIAFEMELLKVTRTQKFSDTNSHSRSKALGQKVMDTSSGWMLRVRLNPNSRTG